MSIPIECVICYEIINNNHTITFANCVHGNHIHAECILKWNNTCPICRVVINDNIPITNNHNMIINVTEIYSNRLYQFNNSNTL